MASRINLVAALAAFCAIGATFAASAAGIGGVSARQRLGRGNAVDVEFELEGVRERERFMVGLSARTRSGDRKFQARTFLSEPIAKAGRNRVIWDFGRDIQDVSPSDVMVSVSATPLSADSPIYCVIDVSGGREARRYPVWYTTKPPDHVQGAVSEPCQTSEIWFRRIPAGTFRFGGAHLADNFDVALTNDFYMGIFEMTQRQYFNIAGKWPSRFSNETCRASRPVDSLVMGDLRAWKWPDPNAIDPGAGSPIGRLRAKSGIMTIDLPTEAQWEYCAQDGGFGERDWYRYGNRPLESIARCAANNGGWSAADGTAVDLKKGTAAVGSYLPNRWGLYDLLGNVEEICLDAVIDSANSRKKLKAYYAEKCGLPVKEPIGPAYSAYYKRACRGGRFSQLGACTVFYRYGNDWNRGDMSGFRLCFACEGTGVSGRQTATALVSAAVPIGGEEPAFRIMPASGTSAVTLADTNLQFFAGFIDKDFEIDGRFSGRRWPAAPLPPLVCCKDGSRFPYPSRIQVCYSRTALYVGGELMQPMAQVHAQYDQWHQPIWEDDNVEISFSLPVNGTAQPYHYAINPLGSVADLMNGNREYWTRGLKAKAVRHGDRWTFEMKIPYEGVPMERPVAGDYIGMRVCRTVHAPERAVGSVPRMLSYGKGPLASYAKTESFARLCFGKPVGADAAANAAAAAEMSNFRQVEFRETLKGRLQSSRRRLDELAGCSVVFADEVHPLFVKARAGLAQMRGELDGFERKHGEAAGKRGTVPVAAAKRFLGAVEGFNGFVSDFSYFAWLADPWGKGDPSDRPPADAGRMPERLEFEQAGNEREAVCLELAGALTGSSLDLRIVPQSVNAGGTFISCDRFEVRIEPFVRFEGEVITAPLVQAAGNLVTLSPGVTKRVWITFDSRGVPPGEYRTKIVLKAAFDARVADREIPVTVKVWNFRLPETKDWPLPSFFWGPNLFRNDEVALLRLMHDYHVTHGWTKGRQYWYGLKNDRNVVWPSKEVEKRGFDQDLAQNANGEFFRVAKELGMKFVIGWNIPAKLEWYDIMVRRLRGIGLNDDEFIFKGLIRDEFMARHIPVNAKARSDVWSYSTNLWFQAVLLSTPPPAGPSLKQIEEAKLPEFYKMWTVIHGLLKDPVRGPETMRVLKSKGAKVWSYKCERYMQRRDLLGYFRFYPWECRMMGLDGMALYTIFTPEGDDGWDSRDGYDEGLCWRGIGKRPIPTKRLEAVREGLEDVAYMDRLERELARIGAAGKRYPEFAALLDGRGDIIKAESQERVNSWRLAAGRAIDVLSRVQTHNPTENGNGK